jgi:hypothetical protein
VRAFTTPNWQTSPGEADRQDAARAQGRQQQRDEQRQQQRDE